MRRLLVVACLCVASCSYAFGPESEWSTVGAPLSPEPQRVLIPLAGFCGADLPEYPFSWLEGADGATWLSYRDNPSTTEYRLVRLGDPTADEGIPGGPLVPAMGRRAVHFFDSKNQDVLFHWPGMAGTRRFHLANQVGNSCCSFGVSQDDEVLFWPTLTSLEVMRTDGLYRRSFPSNPIDTSRIQVFDDVVVEWRDDHWRIHSTRSNTSFDDATTAANQTWMDYRREARALLHCAPQGLFRIPVDGGPSTRLDDACLHPFVQLSDACTPSLDAETAECQTALCPVRSPWLEAQDRVAYFRPDSGGSTSIRLASVPLAGGAVEITSHTASGFLTDLCGTHTGHFKVGDGLRADTRHSLPLFVDGRLVAEHGRGLRFSRDCTRVRFLRHTGTLAGTGQLMAGPIDGPYQVIAENVLHYDELTDGRLIAAVNIAFVGSQNRVVLLDEARHLVRPLVEGARDYRLLPDQSAAMVRLVRPGLDESVEPMEWARVKLPTP